MRIGRYLLALVPLSAIWLYALGQSSGQIFALIDGITEATNDVPAQSEEPVDSEPSASVLAADTAAKPSPADPSPPEPFEVARAALPAPRAPDGNADAYDAQAYLDESADPFAGQHTDITDPRIRRLLQPAWAD